jgi:phosphopantetheinyl transferase (holo-ACP synthase)
MRKHVLHGVEEMNLQWNTEVSKNILEQLLDQIDDLASADSFFEHPWVVEVSEKASSEKPDHRNLIRERLLENIIRFSGPMSDDPNFPFYPYFPTLGRGQTRAALQNRVLNLDQPPQVSGVHLSISHNNHLGGFVISDCAAGFDIEDRNRINKNIIQRVSSEDEIKKAPFSLALWGAKEAAWKALQQTTRTTFKPQLISEIEITNWNVIKASQVETFEVKNLIISEDSSPPPAHGRGCVIYLGSHLFSFFFVK